MTQQDQHEWMIELQRELALQRVFTAVACIAGGTAMVVALLSYITP